MSHEDVSASHRHESTLQPGQPGYRTQPGRSGYDPFETDQEAGRVVGLLLRQLFERLARLFGRRSARR